MKKLPKNFLDIFHYAVNNAQEPAQLSELSLQLNRLKGGNLIKWSDYEFLKDLIEKRRTRLGSTSASNS